MRTGPAHAGDRPERINGSGWSIALMLAALALLVYWGGQWLHTGQLLAQSPFPYFTYYARSLLDGHLHFTRWPPQVVDLSLFEGQVYMHFPPFPSILLLPFVASSGLEFPDRAFSVCLAALNGGLFYLLLCRLSFTGLIVASRPARIGLSLFFLFGTAHFYLSITGNPWELAHVVCNFLVILALLAALSRRYLLAALLYVAILFTRSHIVLTAPVVLALFVWQERKREDRPATAGSLLVRLLPALLLGVAGVALLLWFNHTRFGELFENGISYHKMHPLFRERFSAHGYFDLAYLPRNLEALFLLLPKPLDGWPYFRFTPQGLSLFLASPLYLYLLLSLRRGVRRQAAVLWAVVIAGLVPILLLVGTGEYQFGHRYSSDLQVFMSLLVLIGMNGRLSKPACALLLASIAINGYGAWWFVSGFAG